MRGSDQPPLFVPEAEAPPDWSVYQNGLARRAVAYAQEHSSEARRRLAAAGVGPSDVETVEDLAPIPVLPKDDLPTLQNADPPFGGMLAVSKDALRRIFLSPGPILDPQGDRPDFWRTAPALWAAGFRAGDVVQNTFSHHLTPAGVMFDEGLRTIGCVVIPGGVGNADWQIDVMARTEASGYVGTPDFLLTLLQSASAKHTKLALRRAYVSGGPLPSSLRTELQDTYAVDVFQGYGTADAGTLAYECASRDGWHIAPSVVVEILDPATGTPLDAEAPGEVVVTSPNDVYPLVRFGTGDLSAWNPKPCSCGRTSPRLVGFLGRVGEGIKVRGMFVHPRQLAEALAVDTNVVRYQGVVSQREHRDELTIRVETSAQVDPQRLVDALRRTTKLRAEIEVVAPGTIPDGEPSLVDGRELS